jgi:hypothetical protein
LDFTEAEGFAISAFTDAEGFAISAFTDAEGFAISASILLLRVLPFRPLLLLDFPVITASTAAEV